MIYDKKTRLDLEGQINLQELYKLRLDYVGGDMEEAQPPAYEPYTIPKGDEMFLIYEVRGMPWPLRTRDLLTSVRVQRNYRGNGVVYMYRSLWLPSVNFPDRIRAHSKGCIIIQPFPLGTGCTFM